MSLKLLLIILFVIVLTGCNRRTVSNQQAASASGGVANQSATVESSPTSVGSVIETKYLRGSIGNTLGLQMKLVREGEKLSGSYSYQKVGTRIALRGSIDKDNYLTLEEYDASGTQTGMFKGLWSVKPEDGMVNIAGNWTKPDGKTKTAFSLHEEPIYLSGSAEFTAKTIRESNKKLKYEIDAEYPQVSGSANPSFERFNQAAGRMVNREVAEFRKSITEPPAEDAGTSSSGSSLDIGYTVALATDDLISVEFDVGTYYSGAAHPNSNAQVLNFDIKNGRTLRLGDLFKPGAKYLQALSSFAIRDLKKRSAKEADGMLDNASIESGAAATPTNYQNWTITKKGLAITFDPYQVGPYAAGPQYVVVPYAALKEMIDPNGLLAMYLK